jgi:NAD(P)H-hydrate epimerase
MKLPIVSCAEMRRIEEETFAGGVTAESLMEKVGLAVARAVGQFTHTQGRATVYYGKGNNGGDALVAARYLAIAGWEVELRAQECEVGKLAALTRMKLEEFNKVTQRRNSYPGKELLDMREVILDGLLGTGASGPLREDVRALTREMNARRIGGDAMVFAIDLPTGLDADTGEADGDCVVADVTVTAGYAKSGLVADGASAHVGRLCVAELEEFEAHAPQEFAREVAAPGSLRGLLARRNFDSYKNQYGRIGIVAGSVGFTGAAVLCAGGAVRAGAGLVTIYAPEDIHGTLAAQAPPEVMVRLVRSYEEVLEEKHDVLAVGPGLGKERAGAILQLVRRAECPMVLDADGLNIVAEHGVELLSQCAGPRLLTPHPGEMARLFPAAKGMARYDAATRFTEQFAGARFPITLLLKGSRTIIHEQGRPASYNTTGTPAMGSGGMGDVLTGVCAALMGQHLAPYDAARLGAWLCGRAAEWAVGSGGGISVRATGVIEGLGDAFEFMKRGI